MNLDALVAPLRADVVSGAAVVARAAAELTRRVAAGTRADTREALCARLAELSAKMLEAQPAMAPLVALSIEVLAAADGAETLDDARRAAAEAARSFRASLDRRAEEVGRRTVPHLPPRGTILTLSSSSTVRCALLEAARTREVHVACLESRPMAEGQALAGALARKGIRVLFAVDAAAEALLPSCSAVLMGADSIGDGGLVNKIGSVAVVEAAGRHGIPVLVAADRTKLLPPGFPQPTDDERPPEEVWRAPAGVRVWNRYFERVDLSRVRLVVTEEGALTPEEVKAHRESLAVPPALSAWAASRT